VSGLDYNRVCLIGAVLEKSAGLRLATQDTYVKVAGGLEVTEPAVDLAIAIAMTSSILEKPIRGDTAAVGEIGLGGEIRRVPAPGLRVAEALRMGFTTVILPAFDAAQLDSRGSTQNHGATIIGVKTVEQALHEAMA
jgi:DNA repair protein RadA/Sms